MKPLNPTHQVPFSQGSWMPDRDPARIGPENFSKFQNMKYTDSAPIGVAGYELVNFVPIGFSAFYPAASGDDGYSVGGAYFSTDSNSLIIGADNATYQSFYPSAGDCARRQTPSSTFNTGTLAIGRTSNYYYDDSVVAFGNVTIPVGSTVVYAIVTLYHINYTITVDTFRSNCRFADDADPSMPTTYTEFDAMSLTSAIAKDGDITLTPYQAFESPSLITPVQSLIDKPAWASGNSMVFVWEDDGTPTYQPHNEGHGFMTVAGYYGGIAAYYPKLTIGIEN